MSDIVFRADSIAKRFGTRRVLHAATLWARQGSIAALLGRNGSGKSTLFRIAAGLLRADQGVILFDGQALVRPRLHALARRGVFFLPERGLLPHHTTPRDLMRIVADRFARHDDMPRVVDQLHLGNVLDRLTGTLSGGEQRRTEVALALLRAPRVFLADEPFMGIAPVDADTIALALRDLAATGCALVVSGHEVRQILDIADEVMWITAGTTHSLGTATQARAHWQFRREYLSATA